MGDSNPVVLACVADRVATVTLNRPAVRNALNRAIVYALWDAVTAAGEDPGVDVVILTGAGPAFCAGVDLREVAGQVPPSAEPRGPGESGPGRDATGLYRFLPVIAKPVIGAINGPAVTGGLEIALQCTFLVASERARFADTHGRVGVMPGGGMTVLLTQAVGLRKATELSLTGNFVTAEEALRLGLVNHVVPHEELLPFARRLAADIASNDQAAVRLLHQHYRRLANAATLTEGHLLEGLMAETWEPGTSLVGDRREQVIARGRAQAGPPAGTVSPQAPQAPQATQATQATPAERGRPCLSTPPLVTLRAPRGTPGPRRRPATPARSPPRSAATRSCRWPSRRTPPGA